MLFLLALLACEPDAVDISDDPIISTTPDDGQIAIAEVEPVPVTIPPGEPIVRDCFGGAVSRNRQGAGGGPGGAIAKPRPTPTPQRRPAKPVDSTLKIITGAQGKGEAASVAAPAVPSGGEAPAMDAGGARTGGDNDGVVSGLIGGNLGADEGDVAAVEEGQPVAQDPAPPADMTEREKTARDQLGVADEEKPDASRRALDDDIDGEEWEPEEPVLEAIPEPDPEPVLDWGATVHLSNDDSMSLASAQRVLYAAGNGIRLQASEIRPHELLNYFSFDTSAVSKARNFSVLGSAEQSGDTLSVALAVKGANPPRQPLDLTLVVDRSGSMNAEGRMEYTKRGMRIMTDSLKDGDRVDLVLFDSNVCTPLENFVVGRDDMSLLTSAIEQIRPNSATDLDSGLREAYRIQTGRDAAETHQRNRRVMLITDAQLNTGNVNQSLVSEVGKQFEDHGIRLTGVGVGRDFNDKMLDQLTEKGKGAYVYLGSDAVVDRVFGPGFESLTRTLAHDVRFALDLPDSLAMERFYGEEASTNPEDVQPINYYAGTSQVFLQDLTVRGGRVVRDDPVVLRITFRDANTGEPGAEELRTTVGALLDGDRHNLHKAQALMAWSDILVARAIGGDACGSALGAYSDLAGKLTDDAEIAYVNGLTGQVCRVDMSNVLAPGVAYKVRVDSDIPIAEVGLACGASTYTERLSGSDTIARFDAAKPGSCTLTLQGTVAMRAAVEVPETGGDVRCMVRGGRMSCS